MWVREKVRVVQGPSCGIEPADQDEEDKQMTHPAVNEAMQLAQHLQHLLRPEGTTANTKLHPQAAHGGQTDSDSKDPKQHWGEPSSHDPIENYTRPNTQVPKKQPTQSHTNTATPQHLHL